jgi:hypothetical protein
MRLVRFGEARTGIWLEWPTGPHILDVVASVGDLSPDDPISHGILNGILRDGGGWGPLIQHWAGARAGLAKLARMASRTPDHPGLVIHSCAELDAMPRSTRAGEIVALGIAESGDGFSHCLESSRDCEMTRCIYSARSSYRG